MSYPFVFIKTVYLYNKSLQNFAKGNHSWCYHTLANRHHNKMGTLTHLHWMDMHRFGLLYVFCHSLELKRYSGIPDQDILHFHSAFQYIRFDEMLDHFLSMSNNPAKMMLS